MVEQRNLLPLQGEGFGLLQAEGEANGPRGSVAPAADGVHYGGGDRPSSISRAYRLRRSRRWMPMYGATCMRVIAS